MYNDYYLSSIDNKLNNLNQIISNQETIISQNNDIITEIKICYGGIAWVVCLLFVLVFYYFYHNCFNRYK